MAKYPGIRATLEARIASGAWAPGAAIPHEAELAREFGVTRPTVGRALRDLVAAGMIERRRRAGSRVARRAARVAEMTLPQAGDEIAARGRRPGYRCLSRRIAPPPPAVAQALEVAPGEAALHVRALHLADSAPWQLEDRWISLAAVPEAAREPFEATPPGAWLVARVPWSVARHVLRACAATPDEAAALGLSPGAPLFEIARTTWNDGRPVTAVRLLHPGAGFELVCHDRAAAP